MSIAAKAIQDVGRGSVSYCKFLSANDTGDTGAHQAGIYVTKNAISILFDHPGQRGENMDKYVDIKWQDDFTTQSRFIYYGGGTRNEYRITRFKRGFPFLSTEHTGDLFVLIRIDAESYLAYILSTDDEINEFLDAFAMSPANTGALIIKDGIPAETKVDIEISRFIESLTVDFPSSFQMSETARIIHHRVFDHEEDICLNPDKELLLWTEMEYTLFRKLELVRYHDMLSKGFADVDQFIEIANMVLNRRKSRAGKSLEHHLSTIFSGNSLPFNSQAITEGNRRPDFLFPGSQYYHNSSWPSEKLVFLGAKTTCKDRWRQILNEASRISNKHLFTLQQGISPQQLREMSEEKVTLVVPRAYIDSFPREFRSEIWTLKKFIEYVRETTI